MEIIIDTRVVKYLRSNNVIMPSDSNIKLRIKSAYR